MAYETVISLARSGSIWWQSQSARTTATNLTPHAISSSFVSLFRRFFGASPLTLYPFAVPPQRASCLIEEGLPLRSLRTRYGERHSYGPALLGRFGVFALHTKENRRPYPSPQQSLPAKVRQVNAHGGNVATPSR